MTEKYFWTPEEVYTYYKYLEQGKSLVLPNNVYCTENFGWNEVLKTNSEFFKTPPSQEILNNLKSTADVLQVYREKIAKPIIITSSLRTKEEQEHLIKNGRKPSATSLHLEGLAMDFVVVNANLTSIQDYLNRVHAGEVEYGHDYTHISLPTFSKSYLRRNNLDVNKFYGKLTLQGISIEDKEKNKIIKRFKEKNYTPIPSLFNFKENLELFKDKKIYFI